MSKLQEMYNGWKNLVVPEEELKPYIEKVAKGRLDICNKCPHHSKNVAQPSLSTQIRFDDHCTLCGCTLSAKTRSLLSECPDVPKRWGAAIIDNEQ